MIEKYLKLFGTEGLPKGFDSRLLDTWDAHNFNSANKPRDRVMSVLGFLHLLKMSSMDDMVQTRINVPQVYNDILLEEFSDYARVISKQFLKYRLLDVLRIYKTKVVVLRDPRTSGYVLRVDWCLETKRKESLDSALSKLEGLLYRGDMPIPFKEKWKKLPTNSKAKAKSALPTYSELMGSDSTLGRSALFSYNDCSLYAARASGDLLTVRCSLRAPYDGTPWLTPLRKDRTIKALFVKAFAKLSG